MQLMESGDASKRNSLRIPIELLVVLKGDNTSYDQFCSNLSSTGIFVATKTPERVNSRVSVSFELPHTGDIFQTVGIVVWSRSRNTAEGPCGMGIRFEDMNSADRRLLASALDYYATLIEARNGLGKME